MSKWVEVYGEKPKGFSDTEYAWVKWDTGEIELIRTNSYFSWAEVTHYLPAPEIKAPNFP